MSYKIGDKVGIVSKECNEYGYVGKVTYVKEIVTKLYQVEFPDLADGFGDTPLNKFFQFNSLQLIGKEYFKRIIEDKYD